MRKLMAGLAMLGVITSAGLVSAPAAQAAPTTESPTISAARVTNFSLYCRFNKSATARVDFRNITHVRNATFDKVDAARIHYTSLKGDERTRSHFTPDRIRIQLSAYSAFSNPHPVDWTVQGGGLGDGRTFDSIGSWDPAGKAKYGERLTAVRINIDSLGGDTCVSGWRTLARG